MPQQQITSQSRIKQRRYVDARTDRERKKFISSIIIITIINSILLETFIGCLYGFLVHSVLVLIIILDYKIHFIAMASTQIKTTELLYSFQLIGDLALYWSFIFFYF
jgi:hypothetical protein